MIDLYCWTTPNGHKIKMFIEETGTPYTIKSVNISKGEPFNPEFLSVLPDNRIAIIGRSCGHAKDINSMPPVSVARSRPVLFGQTASVVR